MTNWRFYAYDVWGKGSNSWVNDVFESNLIIRLSENPKDDEIINEIYENIGDLVEVDKNSFSEDTIYLIIPVTFEDEDMGEIIEDVEFYGELRRI